MADQENRRKNYFIDKDFQRRFIVRFCILVVLGSIISGMILYLLSQNTVTTAFVNSRLSIISTADYILPALIASSLVTILLIGIATVIVVIYHSHRIAGPLFNVERGAQKIGSGDLTQKIHLRSTDEMAKLADCFNEMADNINARILEIKTKSEDLGNLIDSLKKSGNKQIQSDIEEISRKKEELDEAINFFKTAVNK